MKRYRNCTILCTKGQSTNDLMNIIVNELKKKELKYERYTSFTQDDSLAVYTEYYNLPYSKIILCGYSDCEGVSIVNIVPMPKSGISQIEPTTYNEILEEFIKTVLTCVSDSFGNTVVSDTEDFTIQDIIPLSFPKLKTWLNGFPLTCHPNDTHRWYDFVISLHTNNEKLSLDVLGQYLEDEFGWDEDVINGVELKLESQLDMLEYYDEHK